MKVLELFKTAIEKIVSFLGGFFFSIIVWQYVSFCYTKEWISYYMYYVLSSVQFSHSVISIYDPMDCGMPGFSIELVMLSNHRILYCPLLLLPSIFPSIRVFSNESVLCIRWPKYWRFSFSISLSNEFSGLISFRIDQFDLLAVQGTFKMFSNTTVQKHKFFSTQLSLWYNSHIHDDWKKLQLWLDGPLLTK